MARNRFLNISRSPVLKAAKNKRVRSTLSRAGSIADPVVPGAKSLGLALSGKPGSAIANAGGVLGEVGYNAGSRAVRTARRFKGRGVKGKAIAAARGARTGLRKSAKDVVNNATGGIVEAAEALPGAKKIGKKLRGNRYVRKAKGVLNKSLVSRQRFRTATGGVFSRDRTLSRFNKRDLYMSK